MRPAREDLLFGALAHRARRQMLDILLARPGASVNEVAAHFDFSRIAAMKHLGVLARAGLVLSEKDGRTRRLYFNSVPIQEIHRRWTDRYGALFAAPMAELKARLESGTTKRSQNRA
ncbi:MAG: helix-turn-helix domain-containing protein [Planctomycetota bacterium]